MHARRSLAVFAFATMFSVSTSAQTTVTFNSNSGSGTMSSQTIPASTWAPLTANTFTRNGMTFMGWDNQSTGGGYAYANSANLTGSSPASTKTLYARWGYSAAFFNHCDKANCTGTMLVQVAATTTQLSPNQYARNVGGKRSCFQNWNTSPGGYGTAYGNMATYTFTANVNLFAQWLTNC